MKFRAILSLLLLGCFLSCFHLPLSAQKGPPTAVQGFETYSFKQLLQHGGRSQGADYLLMGSPQNRLHFRRTFNLKNLFGTKVLIDMKAPYIWKIGSDLNLQQRTLAGAFGEEYDVLGLLQNKEELLIIRSDLNQKQGAFTVYANPLNKETLLPEGKPQILVSQELEDRKNPGFVAYDTSPDEDRVLFITADLQLKKLSAHPFRLAVFTPDMKSVWKGKFDLYERGKVTEILDLRVDNQGNAYLLVKEVLNPEENNTTFRYQIHIYTDKGRELEVLNLDPSLDQKVPHWQLDFSPTGNLLCSGFYSDGGINGTRHAFFHQYDPALKAWTQISDWTFDQAFILADQTKQEKNETDHDLMRYPPRNNRFRARNLIQRKDGGAFLIGEEWKHAYFATSQYGMGVSSYNYFYHSIAVLGISPEGEFEWAAKIPKRIATDKEGGMTGSYFLAVQDEKLHFFYTDHERNVNASEESPIRPFDTGKKKSGVVMHATVDRSGLQERSIAITEGGKTINCVPVFSQQLSQGRIVMATYEKGKLRFREMDL